MFCSYRISTDNRVARSLCHSRASCQNDQCDCNQILHSDKDRQILVLGRPKNCPANPKWRTAAILKIEKLQYLQNRLTDFAEILYVLVLHSLPGVQKY